MDTNEAFAYFIVITEHAFAAFTKFIFLISFLQG